MANKLIEIKRVPNAILYTDGPDGAKMIKLLNCRASYPYVGTPSQDKNDEGVVTRRWKINFQMPKKTHKEAKELVREVILELCTENKSNVEPAFWFLKDGDKSERETDHGYFLVSAAEQGKIRPLVLDRKANEMTDIDKIDEMFYGGCWVNGLIRPWFFGGKSKAAPEKKLRKLVSSGYSSVQFVRDDVAYGRGRIDQSDLYESLEDDDGMGGGGETATADEDDI